jgi:predicted Zn-dependent protease
MIPHVKAVIDRAKENKLTAAGFIQRSANAVAVGNKAGLFGYHTFTDSSLTNTMRSAGGASSGWASQTSVSLKDIHGETAARISAEKCLRGLGTKKKLDPGKYTVILEPAAVSDLVGVLGFNFGARDAEQGQSFLSKQGGGTHLGEKMFPEYITLRSDPSDTRLPATPWGPSLLPNERIAWIEKGVVKKPLLRPLLGEQGGKGSDAGGVESDTGRPKQPAGRSHPVDRQRAADHALLVHPLPAGADVAVDRANS